jgi:hypothetical protein
VRRADGSVTTTGAVASGILSSAQQIVQVWMRMGKARRADGRWDRARDQEIPMCLGFTSLGSTGAQTNRKSSETMSSVRELIVVL